MCWHGLNQAGDVLSEPRKAACAEPHYWETFAVVNLPADARTNRDLSTLMERADIQTACSAERLAERSRERTVTKDWRRAAVAIAADPYTVLVHCLGGSTEGETTRAAFR